MSIELCQVLSVRSKPLKSTDTTECFLPVIYTINYWLLTGLLPSSQAPVLSISYSHIQLQMDALCIPANYNFQPAVASLFNNVVLAYFTEMHDLSFLIRLFLFAIVHFPYWNRLRPNQQSSSSLSLCLLLFSSSLLMLFTLIRNLTYLGFDWL